ncbi:Hypothetical protein A7982_09696 [Minicystis rosea]|nr:Hypothetical protein A7982_09696 [Minicystis rosea]
MKAPETTAFEVLDALGLVRLDKRSGDLDGAVPLRVAQACVPLLEGNAFGHQINLTKPIEIRKSLGRVTVEIASPHREPLAAAHRASLPRLVAQGFLARGSAWPSVLEGGVAQVERKGLARTRIRLWTGLLVRADAGVWLRVSATANRRNRFIEIEEHIIPDGGAFVPLVLDITLRSDAPDRVRLEGEIGTLAPFAPGARIDEVPLAAAPEIGEAHAAFYDAAYFAAKKGEPTRKYRKQKPPPPDTDATLPARCRLITAGPAGHAITTAVRFAGEAGPNVTAPSGASLPRIVFQNLVPFEARFDGHTLAVDPDRRALEDGARAVEQTFSAALGPSFVSEHRGALWYLTKYFTPHPPGEPHFFVKPWAFVQTPPGFSCLLEGLHGDGFDVLRGVVSTDVFHATPAVFHVHRAGDPIRVPFGEPLLHVIPIPRRLLHAGFRKASFHDDLSA